MTPALCAFCKTRTVCYEGALYCGAGCSARAEAHEKPPESGPQLKEERDGDVPGGVRHRLD